MLWLPPSKPNKSLVFRNFRGRRLKSQSFKLSFDKLLSQIFDKLHMSVPEFFLLWVNQPESYGKWLGNKPVTITLSLRAWELSGFQVLHTCPHWHPYPHLGFPSKNIGPVFISFSWTMALLEADLIEHDWREPYLTFVTNRLFSCFWKLQAGFSGPADCEFMLNTDNRPNKNNNTHLIE